MCAGQSSFRYYSFHNSDPLAEMSFSLSVVRGDADIYVNAFKGSDPKATDFPTQVRLPIA
jgi:hypothetical protein